MDQATDGTGKTLEKLVKGMETVIAGVDTLQEGSTLQWEKLCEMQAQQLAKEEIGTVMRHLEEVVDALQGLHAPVASGVRRWPWWVHPSCYTLAVVLGIGLGLAALRWRPVQAFVVPLQVPLAQAQKGRK